MAEVTLLDGGLATELERRGHDLSDELWSARLLRDDPAAVRDVHLAYFRAGAQVATTASYQASVDGFAAPLRARTVLLSNSRRSGAPPRCTRDARGRSRQRSARAQRSRPRSS